MKSLQIALLTLSRSLRSAFGLVFMFGLPLLMAGMFALMFGGQADAAPTPQARLALAELDGGAAGLGAALRSPASAALLQVSPAADAASARQAVEAGSADAALVVLPANPAAGGTARLELYLSAARPAPAAVAQALVTALADELSGAQIAAAAAAGTSSPQAALQAYLAASGSPAQLVSTRSLGGQPAAAPAGAGGLVAPLLSGLLIFFAFFTGCNVAQDLLREAENGTLARLFSTPTSLSAILGGKFAAVGLTVLVQVSVLLGAGRLLFGIAWGGLVSAALAGLGAAACATAFGIFVISLLKNTRQAGMLIGGLVSLTGMLGMLGVFTGGSQPPLVSLFTPQGWAVRGLQLALNGAALGEQFLNLLVLLALAAAFFAAGRQRFQSRFA